MVIKSRSYCKPLLLSLTLISDKNASPLISSRIVPFSNMIAVEEVVEEAVEDFEDEGHDDHSLEDEHEEEAD